MPRRINGDEYPFFGSLEISGEEYEHPFKPGIMTALFCESCFKKTLAKEMGIEWFTPFDKWSASSPCVVKGCPKYGTHAVYLDIGSPIQFLKRQEELRQQRENKRHA